MCYRSISGIGQSQVAISTALSSGEEEAKAKKAEILRQVASHNYPQDAWTGKSKVDLTLSLPPSDPMDWEPANSAPSLAAAYYTGTIADGESSNIINPYVDAVSYHNDQSKYPYTDLAKELMRRVCVQLTPIMKREGWQVRHLTEFYPYEELLDGLNYQQGDTILIRLRSSADVATFLPFTEIMWIAIHELCHNRFSDHDGDFFELWDELNTWHGIPGGRALHYKQSFPKRPLSVDRVGFLTRGKKVLMKTAEMHDHFSNYANQFASSKSRYVELPKKFIPSVVVRLAQLAKGLDPAFDKPLWKIANAEDYWMQDPDEFAISDPFAPAMFNATYAVDLYLHMYLAGEEFGWHPSSRQLVLEQFGRALAWDCRFPGSGPWIHPQIHTREAATARLVEMVRVIYQETTVENQPLRDIVVSLLKEVQNVCQQQGQLFFDTGMLNQLLDRFSELTDSLSSRA